MLRDRFGRELTYLRLAVTDRCNLRCRYCMPAQGLNWESRTALLTFEELLRLVTLLSKNGIQKVRLTGGEPFLRKDLGILLKGLSKLEGLQLAITTNGSLTRPHIPLLQELGIREINLSLDTLDPQRFHEMTRRDSFEEVRACLDALLSHDFQVKINAVIQRGVNVQDMEALGKLAQEHPVAVRFLEEMPFNGLGERREPVLEKELLEKLNNIWPGLKSRGPSKSGTAHNYSSPEMKGSVGIIPAFTRSFCGTCNRLRITPTGKLRTCLYAQGGLDLRSMLRSGATDEEILEAIQTAVLGKAKDGFEAEAQQLSTESMASIGG